MPSLLKTGFFFFLHFAWVKGMAQLCNPINLGTKTLYTTSNKQPSPTPSGYAPVFINYVSRHGARHLTKSVSSSVAWSILERADSSHNLTAEGNALLMTLQKLEAVEKGNIKNISVEGVQEQLAIAKAIFEQNETLFRLPIRQWKVDVTKEIRTRQTATAFTKALQQQIGKTDSVSYVVNDTTLRFFDLSPAYLRFEAAGPWKNKLQQLKTTLHFSAMIRQMASRWLTAAFIQELPATDQEKLVMDVYGFYAILPSLQQEAAQRSITLPTDSLARFFTCAALEKLSKIDATEDYLSKGPGTNVNGIQVKIAAPLLADFINTTDAFIEQANTPVTLRFCHAETIAPFAALLNLAGANKAVQKIGLYTTTVWDAATVVPLSANVQWVLYKSDTSKHYLVKCLLNGKETRIEGLATKQFPYYNWQNMREFYLKRLQRLKFVLTGNGYQYLQGLK